MEKIKEIIAQKRQQKCIKEVLFHIIKRAPNNVRLHLLEQKLPNYSTEELLRALDTLEENSKITITKTKNSQIPDRDIIRYKASNDYWGLGEEEILIGGVEFPRIFNGDPGDPEDINIMVEALATYDSKIESRVNSITTELTRKYWTNVATIFGLFVAIFALILKSSEPVIINKDVTHWDVFLYKAASLAPLAIILFTFVILLRFVLKKF